MAKVTEHIYFKYFHPTNYDGFESFHTAADKIFLLWSINEKNNFKYYVYAGVQYQKILVSLQRLERDWSS